MIVVLLGVTGSGKTTIGTLLAQRAAANFADADDYHPLSNREKLAAGHPLTDEDRQPWLKELNRILLGWFHAGSSGVLACSALKADYRRTLAGGMPDGAIRFILLEGSKELIASRLAIRHHEYMNPVLLDSQIATLETPRNALRIVNDRTPDEIVTEILSKLSPQQHPAQSKN